MLHQPEKVKLMKNRAAPLRSSLLSHSRHQQWLIHFHSETLHILNACLPLKTKLSFVMWRRRDRWMARIGRQPAGIDPAERPLLHAGWRPDRNKLCRGKSLQWRKKEKLGKTTTRGDDSGDIPQLPRCRLLCSKSHIALHWDSMSLIITRCVCLTSLH